MYVLRILGRPSFSSLSNVLAMQHRRTVKAFSYETDSEMRQRTLLTEYYLMCDVNERHTQIQTTNTKKKREWLRRYHRKQDIDNRILEAGLFKSSDK